ncbi:uncharacterized protein [Rutidosis leptorrhynchoides]|uniref:uncharacterized protein n=1 Tax=Rutidosis leptorrhynchoides TaxID=125765 RepID=UPI003A99872D
MFSFTSFEARIDHNINRGRAPYTFRISGQTYHKIGSLLPEDGGSPRYAQLYFYDTQNEAANRMSAFLDSDSRETVDKMLTNNLIEMLDKFSAVAQAFRMARDWAINNRSADCALRLIAKISNSRQYNAPNVGEVAALITSDFGHLEEGKLCGVTSACENFTATEFSNGKTKVHIFCIHIIEFQKCGLPHVHILIWLTRAYKCKTPEDINDLISAEIPNEAHDPEGYKAVTEYMLHGPCGHKHKDAPCMIDNQCSKHFPKPYYAETTIDEDGYANYRRRNNCVNVTKGKSTLDNSFVVPYNRYLLIRYNAHINVEWCNRSRAIKYLFKYLNKGPDRATIVIQENVLPTQNSSGISEKIIDVDEIKNYLDCRYLSPCEAAWRLFSYDIHFSKPSIIKLSYHLPNQQSLTLHDSQHLSALLQRPSIKETMFTQWFELNKQDPNARSLTYSKIPKEYVWNNDAKEWAPRKLRPSIGRIVYSNPASGERYYLRMLLNIVKGARSFEELRTVMARYTPHSKTLASHMVYSTMIGNGQKLFLRQNSGL